MSPVKTGLALAAAVLAGLVCGYLGGYDDACQQMRVLLDSQHHAAAVIIQESCR